MIAMCSARDIKPQTTTALSNLVGWTIHQGSTINLKKLDILNGVSDSLLSMSRQKRLDFALNGDYTHVAFFDDDMAFPPDTVGRLLKHDVDFVCSNAIQKIPNKKNGVCLDFDGMRINSAEKSGLEEIQWGSLAVSLLKLDPIRKIPKPHFEVLWHEWFNNGNGGYEGEDHYFMRKLKATGIKLYCDHDVSMEVKHIGDYLYGF